MGNNRNQNVFRERTTLKVLVVAMFVAIAGFIILYISQKYLEQFPTWKLVFQEIGGLLFITAAITLLWELYVKREFLEEVLMKAKISRDIETSGLIKITNSFHGDIEWDRLITSSSKIDVFFAYGSTWRNSHIDALRTASSIRENRIRIILPDPECTNTIINLAERFNYTTENLIDRINEAKTFFNSLKKQNGADIKIWFYKGTYVFTFYRFDKTVIIALYMHRQEKSGVPTFVCEQGGTLCDFVHKEVDAILDPRNGMSREAN